MVGPSCEIFLNINAAKYFFHLPGSGSAEAYGDCNYFPNTRKFLVIVPIVASIY
jgi:hypothetical protein